MYDAIIIGAGLSGLSAASVLAKQGLKVAVVEKGKTPGGTCGIFKRKDTIFDQGCGMLFGFGEKGYNSHRFLFNILEEPFTVIRHKPMYAMDFGTYRIVFEEEIDKLIDQLSAIFPDERNAFERFYADLWQMYHEVMVEVPMFTTADETDIQDMIPQIKKHPKSYLKFLRYMNISAETLLRKYFQNEEVLQFYDKLTMTYCYTTIKESPAVLAAVMFIENHVGGSYYPAGSTLYLPGKLEKVIEAHGGDMFFDEKVVEILIENNHACGVRTERGETLYGANIIYSGTVWNLYEKLLDPMLLKKKEIRWERAQKPTDSSAVLYAKVKKEAIPEGTLPAEMIVGSRDQLSEDELTVFAMSLDDQTLTEEDSHVIVAIGASFEKWTGLDRESYNRKKESVKKRMLKTLERRFPGFEEHVEYCTVATPRTLKRYTEKNWGACAGPKQMIGQHMLKRLHTRNRFANLYCCGESTVMGTGTPTVTISGITAANALLKAADLPQVKWTPDLKDYVTVVDAPFTTSMKERLPAKEDRALAKAAWACQFCEQPACQKDYSLLDVPGIMRRVAVGNIVGALKCLNSCMECDPDAKEGFEENLKQMEKTCILQRQTGTPVAIEEVCRRLMEGES